MSEEEKDALVKEMVLTARQLFPEQAAQAEAWIDRQLKSYGLSYVKLRLDEQWEQHSVNPLLWFGLGIAVVWLVQK